MKNHPYNEVLYIIRTEELTDHAKTELIMKALFKKQGSRILMNFNNQNKEDLKEWFKKKQV